MRTLLVYILIFLNSTIALSQTKGKEVRNHFTTFKSKSGKQITINELENFIYSVPNAFIIIGDKTSIERQLKSCIFWMKFPNHTYIISGKDLGKEQIQESIDYILSRQKLQDSKLYLLQLNNEFEGIKTSPRNIEGGKIIQRKDNLCETIKEITGANTGS